MRLSALEGQGKEDDRAEEDFDLFASDEEESNVIQDGAKKYAEKKAKSEKFSSLSCVFNLHK